MLVLLQEEPIFCFQNKGTTFFMVGSGKLQEQCLAEEVKWASLQRWRCSATLKITLQLLLWHY